MITHIAGQQHRLRFLVSAVSERGARSSNEDRLGMIDVGNRAFCCVLADGAGGHGQGGLAAQLTVDAVLDGFRQNPLFASAGMASLISMAEHSVVGEQPLSVSRKHMSTTVVLLCVEQASGRALWAHWGDSRLYCFRNGVVHRVTEDHSVVQQLLHAGIYRQEDPRHLPNRNVLAGAIGAESQVPPTVLSQALELYEGDAFLLCSDGLWETLHESHMEEALAHSATPDSWLEAMAASIRKKSKSNQDNFSAIAVWVASNEESA